MLQVLPKWRITVNFPESVISQTFYISDHFVSNVTRKVAEISFEKEPRSVLIELVTY